MSNSQRLDSISRPLSGGGSSLGGGSSSNGAAKPASGLKFKPKAVSRKSKEERDANAASHYPTEALVKNSSLKNKARLGTKNAKRNPQAGTTVISAGPLAAGAVSLGVSNASTSRGQTLSGGSGRSGHSADFLSKLRGSSSSRSTGSGFGGLGDESDDDMVDEAKINMGSSSSWLDEEAELLPVRAARTKHLEYGEVATPDKSVKTEFHRETSVIPSAGPSREGSVEPEAIDVKLALIPEANTEVTSLNVFQDEQERNRLRQDYLSITKFVTSYNKQNDKESYSKPKSANESEDVEMNEVGEEVEEKKQQQPKQPLMFVQLPELLPKFVKSKIDVKLENPTSIYTAQDQEEGLSGVIGKLRYHKSGKITMKLGDIVLDVTRGGSSSFIQDVVMVDHDEKSCIQLGTIKEKIIASPSFS